VLALSAFCTLLRAAFAAVCAAQGEIEWRPASIGAA
jgi:hypothetical protein